MGIPHPNKLVAAGRPLKWFLQIVTAVLLFLAVVGLVGDWPLHLWNVLFTAYIGLFFSRPIKDFPFQVRLAFTAACLLGSYLARPVLWFLLLSIVGSVAVNYDLFVRLLSLLPFNRYEPFSLTLVRDTLTSAPKDGRFASGKRPDV